MFNTDDVAKEINDALAKDLPGARLKHLPIPASMPKGPTISNDIEALKIKLDALLSIISQVRNAL
jgi:hypothetical protein